MQENINILFATDFSMATKSALRLLPILQQSYNADISLMHVISSFWKDWLSSGLYSKEALQRLEIWQQKITPGLLDPSKLYVQTGSPADAIVGQAKKIGMDLIMMGIDVQKRSHHIPGYTAESVVRYAKQSVWLCHSEKIQRVICGVDASSVKPIEVSLNLCRRFSAKLCLVSVLPRLDFNPLGMDPDKIQEEEDKFKQQKIQELQNFLSTFDFSGLEVEKLFPWGIPSRVILDIAEDFDYDLIVIGAKGRGMIKNALMGSTAEKILRRVPSSLLVVR